MSIYQRPVIRIRTSVLFLIVLVVLLVPIILTGIGRIGKVQAIWWNDDYAYRAKLTFVNSGAQVTNQRVKFDVDTRSGSGQVWEGRAQSDCDDVRFVDASGNILPYYIDSATGACNTSSTDFWVLMPTITAGTSTVYLYYGDPNALSAARTSQFTETQFVTGTVTQGSEEKGLAPALRYGFDEGSGTTAYDSSPNKNNAYILEAGWNSGDTCVLGSCLSFDGENDVVIASNAAAIDMNLGLAAGFTVSTWIRVGSDGEGDVGQIFQKGTTTYLRVTGQGSDGYADLGASLDLATADASTTVTNGITVNQWHFVTLTYADDGDDEISLYIDGVLKATSTNGNGAPAADANSLFIGGTATANFNGWIDEFKISRGAWDAQRVRLAAMLGAGPEGSEAVFGTRSIDPNSSGLLAYWNLDSKGTDGSGNRVGLRNAQTDYVTGKFGSGAEFDPTSPVSQFQYASSGRLNTAKTISFWVNPDSTTNYFLSLSTASITATGGTITTSGLTNPSIYVNGLASTTLAADTWQHVVVTHESNHSLSTSNHHVDWPYYNQSPFLDGQMYCITSDDCKVVYVENSDSSLRFMDCDDSECSSGTVSVIDGGTDCTLSGTDGCSESRTVVQSNNYDLRISIYCPAANDCKITYTDFITSALLFADCDDETCSSGDVSILDGTTGCQLTEAGGDDCSTSIGVYNSSLICPTTDSCKISYSDATNTALKFAACNDAECSDGQVSIVDGAAGCRLTGGDACGTQSVGNWNSLQCPTADNCKIAYYDTSSTALMFADCDDADCLTGSVEYLDGYNDGDACELSGGDACSDARSVDNEGIVMDCPSSTDCKIAYVSGSDLYFGDCSNEQCTSTASASVEIVDGTTGCGLSGCSTSVTAINPAISCVTGDNCKLAYYRSSASVNFADCDGETCSSGRTRIVDGGTACTLTGGDGCMTTYDMGRDHISMYCVAADDCKINYQDWTMKSQRIGDCDDESCSAGSSEILDGEKTVPVGDSDIFCVSPDDCKFVYYAVADSSIHFMDCDDASCTSGTDTVVDGGAECSLTGCSTTITAGDNGVAMYCESADHCKIVYNNGSATALQMAICTNATCTAGSISVLDGTSGCVVTGCDTGAAAGYGPDIYCPSGSTCKIIHREAGTSELWFTNCGSDTCTGGSMSLLDGSASCVLTDLSGDGCSDSTTTPTTGQQSLYCPTKDTCKVVYYDQNASVTALKLGSCANEDCSSGRVEVVDGYTGCGLNLGDQCNTGIDAGNNGTAIVCPTASTCKIAYYDATNTALRFAACGDEYCSYGQVEVLDGDAATCGLTGCADGSSMYLPAMQCPTASTCKIAYHTYPSAQDALSFIDCGDAFCSSGTTKLLDGYEPCTLTNCANAISAGASDNSMSCASEDDCKILYFDYTVRERAAIRFADLSSEDGSTGLTTLVNSGMPTLVTLGKVGTNYFDGTMDEVKLFNRTLSAAEVRQLYTAAPPPIAHWPLDEGSGTSASDISGNGHTGTLTNGPGWVSGKMGKAVSFDGASGSAQDDYIVITSTASLSNPVQMTYSAWIYPKSLGEGSLGRIFAKCPDNPNCRAAYVHTNNSIEFVYGWSTSTNNYASWYTPDNSIQLNRWNHIAIAYDNSSTGNNPDIYINGVKQSITEENAPSGVVGDDSTENLFIGNNDGLTRTFDGYIDDFRFYTYLRSAQQIIEDMNAGHPAPGSPIGSAVSTWHFDEGYGTSAYDSSVNQNTLTLSTASWTNDGKYGKAFAGNSDRRLSQTDDADLDFAAAEGMTISTWFKRNTVSAQEYLVYKENGNEGYTIYMDSDGDIVFGIGDTSSVSFPEDSIGGSLSKNYDDNQWHQVVAVKDGTTGIYLYVDNKLIASDTALDATATLENAGTFYVGDANATDGTDEFLGHIDELSVYRSSFTQDQVNLLFNQGKSVTLGSLSTDATGVASNSARTSYCPPGNTEGNCAAGLNPGPVGEWKFDEGSGTSTVYDSSGNNFNGSLTGITNSNWEVGKIGKGLRFNTDGTYAQVTHDAALMPAAVTLSTWVKVLSIPANTTKAIISKNGNSSSTMSYSMRASSNASGTVYQIYCHISTNGSNNNVTTFQTISLNTWYHSVCVYDGETLTHYMNGEYKASNTTPSGAPYSNTADIIIPGLGADNPSNSLNAVLDDMKIFPYARTQSQVAWDYSRGAPIAHYKLDECQGGTVYNYGTLATSTTPYNGTITSNTGRTTGSCNSGVSTQMWNGGSNGKFNGSLAFDGMGDKVTIGDIGALDDATQFSFAGWVKASSLQDFGIIVSKYNSVINYLSLGLSGSGAGGNNDFEFCIANGSDSCGYTQRNFVQTGQWYHVVGVYDGTQTHATPATQDALRLKIYVNGMQESLGFTQADGTIPATTGSNATSVEIGSASGVTVYALEGQIDDVRIYNYALSPVQVKTVMNEGSAVRFSGPTPTP